MSRQKERVATLTEVRDLVERHQRRWRAIPGLGKVALREVRGEIDAMLEASVNAWREGVRSE